MLYPASGEEDKSTLVALVAVINIAGSPAANPFALPTTDARSTVPHNVPAAVDTLSGVIALGTANVSDSPARTALADTEATNRGSDASRAAAAVALQGAGSEVVRVCMGGEDHVREVVMLLVVSGVDVWGQDNVEFGGEVVGEAVGRRVAVLGRVCVGVDPCVMLVVGVGSLEVVYVVVFGGVSEAVLPLLVASVVCVGE